MWIRSWRNCLTIIAVGVRTRKWHDHTHASHPITKSTDSHSDGVKLVNGNSIMRHLRRQSNGQALWRAFVRRVQRLLPTLSTTQAQLYVSLQSPVRDQQGGAQYMSLLSPTQVLQGGHETRGSTNWAWSNLTGKTLEVKVQCCVQLKPI